MRILWFSTNHAGYKFHDTDNHYGYGGAGWMSSLQSAIVKQPSVELGLCFMHNPEFKKEVQEEVTYYIVPHHTKHRKDKIIDFIRINDETRDRVLWPYYIEQFKRVILDFKPDVIEVFGSELYIGLSTIAASELRIPCCLHLQGILNYYFPTFLPTGVAKLDYLLSGGIKGLFGKMQYWAYWERSCHREKAVLKAVPHVIGRTQWDKQALEVLNPDATYHYGGEILRPCFYEDGVRQKSLKPVIVTTSSDATYKGFDIVLKIANILKNEMGFDFEWKVFGNVHPNFFEKFTGIHPADVNVELCGVASAERLREEMLKATVYLQPSYIENSPNSVAEAQILGLPVVATNVGGTSSMVEDGKTGFLFPCTDLNMGATALSRLIQDEKLNSEIGEAGKQVALKRHNPKEIVTDLISLYKYLKNPPYSSSLR